MSMKRRSVLVIGSVAAVFALSACVDIESDAKVGGDGKFTGTLTQTYEASSSGIIPEGFTVEELNAASKPADDSVSAVEVVWKKTDSEFVQEATFKNATSDDISAAMTAKLSKKLPSATASATESSSVSGSISTGGTMSTTLNGSFPWSATVEGGELVIAMQSDDKESGLDGFGAPSSSDATSVTPTLSAADMARQNEMMKAMIGDAKIDVALTTPGNVSDVKGALLNIEGVTVTVEGNSVRVKGSLADMASVSFNQPSAGEVPLQFRSPTVGDGSEPSGGVTVDVIEVVETPSEGFSPLVFVFAGLVAVLGLGVLFVLIMRARNGQSDDFDDNSDVPSGTGWPGSN